VITSKIIQCVDTHSCGKATRVILGGIPTVLGKTMKEKYTYFKSNLDNLRTTLFQEPRGFDNMLGVFVVEPTQEDADCSTVSCTMRHTSAAGGRWLAFRRSRPRSVLGSTIRVWSTSCDCIKRGLDPLDGPTRGL